MGGTIGKIARAVPMIGEYLKIGDAFSSGGGREEDERTPRYIGKIGDTIGVSGGKVTVNGNVGDSWDMGGGHKEDEHKEGLVDKSKDKIHGEGGHEHKGHDGEKKKKKKKEHGHEHDGHSSSSDSDSD